MKPPAPGPQAATRRSREFPRFAGDLSLLPSSFSLSLVIPCWNEAHRFDPVPFLDFLARADGVRLLLVDDV
ncbi:MAG TPA: hypothetical protein PLL69_06910, partial [Gemmatimonadales bacterium]|nr:hypothetical protein [Gemmatimonadales bacterium]